MTSTAPPKTRLQAGAACENCRRRKSRCDAVRPRCSNCAIRNTSCRYPALDNHSLPGNENPEPSQSHRRKLRRAQEGFRRPVYGETETARALPPGVDLLSSGIVGDNNILSSSGSSSRLQALNPGNSLNNTSHEYSQSRLPKRPYDMLAAHESDAPESYYSGSSTFCSILSPPLNGLEDNRSARQQLSAAATGSLPDSTGSYGLGHVPGGLESWLELPDRNMADNLVDAYFNKTHKLYPFLHEGLFRAEYETMWAARPSPRSHPRLSWLGLLNMVFVHGCEHCDSIPQDQVPATAGPFVSRARNMLRAQVFSSSTLETVQSLLLMCYYLQGTVGLKECWSLAGVMFRIATDMGLHLNPPASDILPVVEREVRKRAWWGCFILDRTLSMKFGRAPCLRIEDGNVDLPLEVDDHYYMIIAGNDSAIPRQPVGTPSFVSLFVATIKLSQIVHNMLVELYLRRPGTYDMEQDERVRTPPSACSRILSKVMLLDGQLQSWWDRAPRHLTQQTTEGEQSWINFQRQQTALKISARVCIDCARQTIRLIGKTNPRQQLNSIWYNAQYVSASMCVLLVLGRMDEQRLSLLQEDVAGGKDKDCLIAGMEFLQAASQTSGLAARYLTALRQLSGGDMQLGGATASLRSEAAENDNSREPAAFQRDVSAGGIDPLDPTWGVDLDFGNFDDWLSGAELWGESLNEH